MNLQHINQAMDEEYVSFELEDFVQNPVALERIRAGLTQEELAERLKVSQAYISKIENQSTVPPKLIDRIKKLFEKEKLAK